jgi:type VI secretion system protein ImpK
MTPRFSKIVDPIFEYVLGLFDRIESGEDPAPESEWEVMRGKVSSLPPGPEGDLAKYAIAAWIDEALILDAPWTSREWWANKTLEWEFFRVGQDRAKVFYEKAKLASDLPQKDVLEVFYLCVVLGFLGRYRNPARVDPTAERDGLPASLDGWLSRTEANIRQGSDRPPMPPGKPTLGAPPLPGPDALIWSVFLGLGLSVVFAVVGYLFFVK